MNSKDLLVEHLTQTINNLQSFLANPSKLEDFNRIAFIISECLRSGGRVYVTGNGGSSADASHLCGEMVGKLRTPRNPLPAENLASDMGALTCIANDFGYKYVFSRQLEAKMTSKDVFIGISTSGNSENMVEAFKACFNNYTSILITGKSGSKCEPYAGFVLNVGGNDASETQEAYFPVLHVLVRCIEQNLNLV